MFMYETPCANECGRLVGRKGGRGYCSACQMTRRREAFRASGAIVECEVEGCRKIIRHVDVKVCEMHRARLRRTGELGPAESIRREYGTGGLSSSGYIVRQINGRRAPEHRLAVEESLGRELWPWENVHHRNGIRTDNRLKNLEIWIVPQPMGQRPEDLLAWCDERREALTEAAVWNAR